MIKGAYVLITSVLTAVVYTLLITLFRDRVFEMLQEYLPVPVDSSYNIYGLTDPITWALYAIPVLVIVAGFLYFLMRGPEREADTAGLEYYGTGMRRY